MKMVIIKDSDLREAAGQGADSFLDLIMDSIRQSVGGSPDSAAMQQLNGYQNSLLAYSIFREEIMEGGFIQLIQNGYGPYIFDNPFARSMRLFGAHHFSKLIYKAKKIFDANREDLVRERTDDEFMAMYERYEAFDDLEEEYILNESEISSALASYVDANMDKFVDKII